MFEKLVEYDLGVGVAFQFYNDPQSVLVRLVPYIRNTFDFLVGDKLRDRLDEVRFVHLIRDLGDDDRFFPGFLRLDSGSRADLYKPAACGISLFDAFAPADYPSCREVRRLYYLRQVFNRYIGVVYYCRDALRHLGKIMRRDICGHTDRDAG